MSDTRRAALPWMVALALCTAAPATAAVFRSGQPVMGTVLQVTIVAADDATARALADAAFAEAHHWDDLLTTWRPQGELARLNARAGHGPGTVSVDLAAALQRMRTLAAATGGTFDPAVGPLVDLWRGPATPTAAERRQAGVQHIADVLTLDGRQATLAAGAALDAGGIGKGMALDAIGALLRARGATAAYLDFGGSSQLAIGAPPGSPAGWRVALSGLAPNTLLGAVALRDAALSTSRASSGPSAAGPIIDPRDGRPVFTPRLATVRAADATTAEAWTKALIVFGRPGIATAAAAGLDVFYADADGTTQSIGFRLRPLGEEPTARP